MPAEHLFRSRLKCKHSLVFRKETNFIQSFLPVTVKLADAISVLPATVTNGPPLSPPQMDSLPASEPFAQTNVLRSPIIGNASLHSLNGIVFKNT